MKTVFTVSLQSLRVNKRNTCVTFLVMLLSMALLMTICAVWIALIDLQANMLYNTFLKYFPAENLFERVYSNSSYIDVVLIGIMFICITALISGLSIRNVLTLNDGAKAKTLSVLTTLGASKIHRLIYMITDTLFLALVSIPTGFLLSIGISTMLLKYINQAVCARIGLPSILFLQGKPLFYCVLMAAVGVLSVLIASVRPALRLIGTPPVEIAKTKDAISVVLRETLFDRIINRCFGICGRLASANYENYKRRYRMFTRTMSLSTSFLVLSLLFVAYLRSLESTVDQITTENLLRIFIYIALVALILSLTGACSILYVQFRKRKPEFALLLSTGIRQTQLCGVVAVEMLYYVFRFLYQLMLTTLLGDLLLYIFIGRSEMAFVFPWKQILAVGCGVLLLLLVISLCMIRMVRHINIIDELKKSD